MVGREFVPNEDMGEWTIHLDAPEGTSLEGTTEVAFKLLKELSGIEGVAQIEPSIGVSGVAGSPTHIHFLCQALPLDERKNTQAQIITEMRRRLAAHPELPAVDHLAQRARQRRGHGRLRDRRQHPRPRPRSDRRLLEEGARGGAEAAEPDRRQDQPQRVEPGGPRRRRSQARRRSRRADGDHRQHAAARRRRATTRSRSTRKAPEQYPVKIRVLENQRRDIAEIGRLTVPSATGPGPHRQHRAPRARPRPDDAAALGSAVRRQPDRRRRARATRSTRRRNDVRRMLAGLNMPPTMSFKLQGQSKILDETTANLIMAIGLAMIFVYMVLASQFESFLQPIVIMLVLPICGAVRALHAVDHRPDAEPVERARHAAAARHREEELDPAGGLRQRAARAGPAAARGDRRVVPHAAAADPDDDDGDHRRADPDVARASASAARAARRLP